MIQEDLRFVHLDLGTSFLPVTCFRYLCPLLSQSRAFFFGSEKISSVPSDSSLISRALHSKFSPKVFTPLCFVCSICNLSGYLHHTTVSTEHLHTGCPLTTAEMQPHQSKSCLVADGTTSHVFLHKKLAIILCRAVCSLA